MMRRIVRHVPWLAALGVVITPPTAPGLAPEQRETPPLRQLTFRSEFAGVSADGQNSVWEGSVHGAGRGRLRVELRQVEGPSEAASPVWHVVTRWSVGAPLGARSFTAELEGMVDWRTGATRLSGVITDGWLKGAWVQEEGQFVNGDVRGVLAISPGVARR